MISRRRRGTAALEFAICAVPLLLLVTATLEIGWQLTLAAALDHGARLAGRIGITGAAPGSGTREQAVTEAVLRALPLLQPARLTVRIRNYPSFDKVGQEKAASDGIGGPSAVVEYRLDYADAPLTPVGRAAWGALVAHRATAVVQNEPFPQ